MRDRIGKIDWLVALAAGVLAVALVLLFGSSGFDPSLWEELAVAKGLRPPESIFPGLWRLIVRHALPMLGTLGAVAAGIFTFAIALSVRLLLALLIRASNEHPLWTRLAAPVASASAGLFAVLADPIWRITQVLTADMLMLTLTAVCLLLFFRWVTCGGCARVYLIMLLAGVVTGETPFGFLLPVLFVCGYFMVWRMIIDGAFEPADELVDPDELPKWRMFFSFALGLGAVVAVNVRTFEALDGLKAMGWGSGEILFRYGYGYVWSFLDASSAAAWVLILGVGVLPLVVGLNLFPRLANDDVPMPFGLGVVLFFLGIVGFMQVSPIHGVWFWAWMPGMVTVSSGYVLGLVAICSATSAALAVAAFAMDAEGRLAEWPDAMHRALRLLAPAICLAALAACLCGVQRPATVAMQRLVDDAIAETVAEMGDAAWIFTDGSCDAALELEADRQGRRIYPLNMMSDSSNREQELRKRGLPDEADAAAALQGTPVLLRVWAGEKPNGMARAAVQLGFEFWKRANKPLPKMSGLLARVTGMSDEEAARGIAAAEALSGRILEISAMPGFAKASPALAKAFFDVSWRLSRLARLRGGEELANKLDATNGALKRMMRQVEYERLRTFMQLTPKEGLSLALRRADFVEARRFAMAVLKANEDDPEANFGIGMSYLIADDLKHAEEYLRRCLKERPDEPAVLNNLSIIARKDGRPDEALELARRASKMLPDNEDVMRTLSDAEKAVRDARSAESK